MKSRNYYEIFVLTLTVGFAATWGFANNGAVTSTFPAWIRAIWFGGLALGAVLAIIGEAIYSNISLAVERAALLFLTGLITAYAFAFVIAGIRAGMIGHVLYVGAALVMFAAINYGRAQQIRTEVRSIYQVYQELPTVEG